MGVDAAKAAKTALNNNAYRQAVKGIWTDAEASKLILDHTNAIYFLEDTRPKKGFPKDRKYIVCEICVDDSMVMSEIDTHRELLQFALRSNGLAFEEVRIVFAKFDMRKRHPFVDG